MTALETELRVPDVPRGIEANGINTITEGERKGTPRELFLPWFASNVGVFGISYGAFCLAYGLSVAQSIVAAAIGLLLSFGAVGIVATAGPRGSGPTMVLSRAAYGVRGHRVPSALSGLLMVGWEPGLVGLGTLATATVFNELGVHADGLVKALSLVVIAGLTVAAGVAGFDLVMRLQGFITVVAGVLTVVFIALTLDEIHWSAATSLPSGSTESFIGVIVLVATGFGFGWVNVSADYSRYLPRGSSPRGIFGWTLFGGAIGPLVLLVFGLFLAGSSKGLVDKISADPVGALAVLLPTWVLVPFPIAVIAGFLLLGLATVGLAIDHWRGIPGSVPLSRVAALGVVAVLAAVIVTIATPLGAAIWSYLLSFQNQAISLASTEWESAFSSPLAVVYLSLASCFAAWMWVRSPQPRRATTLLVTAGFLVFAGFSVRNIVFVGPILALQVAWTAPNRNPTPLRGPVALFGAAAAAAALLWAVVLGPARDDPTLGFPVADYAIAHPPKHGRIVTYAGVGSYINWRSPKTPVVLNGWLEHYTPQELVDNYGVLRAASAPDLPDSLRRIHAGAVIAHLHSTIQRLEASGFRAEFTSPDGTYLVRVPHGAKQNGR